MKKITLGVLFLLLATSMTAQTYSTGTVPLFTTAGLEYSAKIDVSQTLVTLTLTGPATRWLGIGFGENSMTAGGDVVIFNGATLSDRTFDGVGVVPLIDSGQSWTVTSNTVSSGIRTVTGTRALNTGEPNDYVFSASPSPITLVFARGQDLTVAYHGGGNCGSTVASFTLDTDKFTLAASQVYPNPSNGEFIVKTPAFLDAITVYSQTGALVRTIPVGTNEAEITVKDLQTGIYLLELKNETETSWKKIIVK